MLSSVSLVRPVFFLMNAFIVEDRQRIDMPCFCFISERFSVFPLPSYFSFLQHPQGHNLFSAFIILSRKQYFFKLLTFSIPLIFKSFPYSWYCELQNTQPPILLLSVILCVSGSMLCLCAPLFNGVS